MSLVTDAAMGTYLGITESAAAPYNAAAHRACEAYCGYSFEAANAIVYYDRSEFFCPSAVTPTLTDADGNALTAEYTFTSGLLKRVLMGVRYGVLQVAYTVGWTSGTAPADVITAIKETAKLSYERGSSPATGEASSVTVDGVSVTYRAASTGSGDTRIPNQAGLLLDPYRLDWGV